MFRTIVAAGICTLAFTLASKAVAEEAYDLKWLRQFGAEESSTGGWSAFGDDGRISVSGTTNGLLGEKAFGESDSFIATFMSDGNGMVLKQYGTTTDDYGGNIIVSKSGQLIVSGGSTVRGARHRDGVPFGPSGATVSALGTSESVAWKRLFGMSGGDSAQDIVEDSEGNIIVAGVTFGGVATPNAGAFDALVIKYTKDGELFWVRQFGGGGGDGAQGVVVDEDDNIYVSGTTQGDVRPDAPTSSVNYDSFVRKYDAIGNLVWEQVFRSARQELWAGLAIDNDGNLLIVDRSELNPQRDGTSEYRSSLTKLDSQGFEIWRRVVTSKEFFLTADLAIYSDGSIFLGSHSSSPEMAGGQGATVAKYSTNGDLLWTKHVPVEGAAGVKSIHVDSRGNVLLSGDAIANDKRGVFVSVLAPCEGD